MLVNSRPSGIMNAGNTCFANAALQCLLSSESFVQVLQESKGKQLHISKLFLALSSEGYPHYFSTTTNNNNSTWKSLTALSRSVSQVP